MNEVYSFSPAFNNLYTLKLYPLYGTKDDLVKYFEFHSPKVSFNGESLEMKRNDITKRFQLVENSPYKRTDEIQITLREDEKWNVKKYHENWLYQFYDKDNDCYLSATTDADRYARYKILRIILPNSDDCIKMLILPSTTGNIDLAWGSSSSAISHNLSYYVLNWKWEKFEQ